VSDLYHDLLNRYFAPWQLERAASCSERDGIELLSQCAKESCHGASGPNMISYSTWGGHVRFGATPLQEDASVTITRLATDAWRRHCAPIIQRRLLHSCWDPSTVRMPGRQQSGATPPVPVGPVVPNPFTQLTLFTDYNSQ
jgi:hypothetical protein